jgi:hypothetical protein
MSELRAVLIYQKVSIWQHLKILTTTEMGVFHSADNILQLCRKKINPAYINHKDVNFVRVHHFTSFVVEGVN